MTNNLSEINDVKSIISELLFLIDDAEKQFKKARNWGFFDILGGGLITDLIKHSKLNNASNIMNRINSLLKDLQRELNEVVIPTDFSMNTFTFSSFADFVFDGFLADTYMQAKIMSSISQIRNLRTQLLDLQDKMNRLEGYYRGK